MAASRSVSLVLQPPLLGVVAYVSVRYVHTNTLKKTTFGHWGVAEDRWEDWLWMDGWMET